MELSRWRSLQRHVGSSTAIKASRSDTIRFWPCGSAIPTVKGMSECYGISVHVCPYCDGFENRDAPVAVWGTGEKGAQFSSLIRQWTHDVVLCTNGEGEIPVHERAALAEQGITIKEAPVA